MKARQNIFRYGLKFVDKCLPTKSTNVPRILLSLRHILVLVNYDGNYADYLNAFQQLIEEGPGFPLHVLSFEDLKRVKCILKPQCTVWTSKMNKKYLQKLHDKLEKFTILIHIENSPVGIEPKSMGDPNSH